MLEQDGKALLYFPVYNYRGMNLDAVHEMLTHPLALPGLSDGGAQVGTVCDASFTTFLMTHGALLDFVAVDFYDVGDLFNVVDASICP